MVYYVEVNQIHNHNTRLAARGHWYQPRQRKNVEQTWEQYAENIQRSLELDTVQPEAGRKSERFQTRAENLPTPKTGSRRAINSSARHMGRHLVLDPANFTQSLCGTPQLEGNNLLY